MLISQSSPRSHPGGRLWKLTTFYVSEASRLRVLAVDQVDPGIPEFGFTAPKPVCRPRCALSCASAPSPMLTDSSSVAHQASAARCRGRSHRAGPCPTILDAIRAPAATSRPSQRACARRERVPHPRGSRALHHSWRAPERSSRRRRPSWSTSCAATVHAAVLNLFRASLEVRGRRSKPSPPLSRFPRSTHPSSLSLPCARTIARPPPPAPIRRPTILPHALGRCYATEIIAGGRAAAPRGSRSTAAARAYRVPSACSAAATRAIAGPAGAPRTATWAGRTMGVLGRAPRPLWPARQAIFKRYAV